MARALMLMGGGFLLSVLWFDLKFDTLAWEALRSGGQVSEASLAVIRSYYGRATVSEMNGFPLIMSMMGLAIVGSLWQLRETALPLWSKIATPLLVIPPVSQVLRNPWPQAGWSKGRMSNISMAKATLTRRSSGGLPRGLRRSTWIWSTR